MRKRVLLLNPPIYDFTAYDFWIKPLGLLTVAGRLNGIVDLTLFDYLDRCHPSVATASGGKDLWSKGRFNSIRIEKPAIFSSIPRYFNRFGLDRAIFQQFLRENAPFDFVLVQTVMTYWYLGIVEVIEDIRSLCPDASIVLGGPYATICPDHCRSLGADLVVEGSDLALLWQHMAVTPFTSQIPYYAAYPKLKSAAIKLTDGCPFDCTYCCADRLFSGFAARPPAESIRILEYLCSRRVGDIAFYDDALLYQPENALVPFLAYVIEKGTKVNFHTPNGLHSRFIDAELAKLMVRAGFKTFHLGFEIASGDWQKQTGSKVFSDELASSAKFLLSAGANPAGITAYQILGHPHSSPAQMEDSMRLANSLGIRIMLSDFSPIPGTPDGQYCRKWIDLAEPLNHNKTAFAITLWGNDQVNRLKKLCKKLNNKIVGSDRQTP
jgi:hypothetical protein